MEQQTRPRAKKNTKVGVVTSNSMQKTVVVRVDRFVQEPLYKKIIRRTARFMAHDEKSECQVGDKVLIVESRPLSRRKRWRVAQVLQRAT
ncbi:MAG: 30S ribosomal protein S17 [Acidobacteria bacterium]|nr:30S ribosomal protein S17 [Acidobacteriota bacterium]